jgi:flagellar hook-associated protein 1 FlgK
VYNEPGDLSLRALMDKFWESWQELSLHPSETASRHAVLQRGETLIDGIHNRYEGLKEIREMLEQDITATVKQVNDLASEIAEVNRQIVKIEAMGDNPNDLLDRRDGLVEKLSNYVNVTVDKRDPDEFTVHTAGRVVVQGDKTHLFATEPNTQNEGYSDVIWQDSGEQAFFRGGKLAGLIELRDVDLREEIQKLDNMTINFIDRVNSIHREAYGLNGETGQDFFVEYPAINNVRGNFDRNGDGEYDHTYLFRVTGNNSLSPQEQIGLEGELTLPGGTDQVSVAYNPNDTVETLIQRINMSGSEVVASLNRNGQLILKGTPAQQQENPDFVIRHLEDSGQFLAGYAGILPGAGEENAYDWATTDAVLDLREDEVQYAVAPLNHPAGWIEINNAMKQDVRAIAAGFGRAGRPAEAGDGSAALEIASLRNEEIMIGNRTTFDQFFSDAVATAGLKGEQAEQALETENLIMKELRDMREAISGVNIDEEMSNLIKFQHGYQATARFVTEVNRMLETIINRMGV